MHTCLRTLFCLIASGDPTTQVIGTAAMPRLLTPDYASLDIFSTLLWLLMQT